VLTQIILEQEIKGFNLLPTNFLRSVIRFYDDKMANLLQPYLDASMSSFMNNQERMRGMMGNGFSPMGQFEELARNNMAMFEKTVGMFNPFGNMFTGGDSQEPGSSPKKPKR
jgi:polyhydroxyalkanoate synthesis regulator protein